VILAFRAVEWCVYPMVSSSNGICLQEYATFLRHILSHLVVGGVNRRRCS
jgi:hypothetical protein